MKKRVSILAALMISTVISVTPLVAGGSDVTGKWTSWKHGDLPVELKSERFALAQGPATDILDGKMVGNRITFKAIVRDGDGEGEKTEFGPACVARISVRRAAR